MSDITSRIAAIRAAVNLRLAELIEEQCEPGTLKDAMSYSLMAGGKRLRPVMCLMSAGMFGDEAAVLDIACAIEMIHTYSLIHDDLPAMDDDCLRRGKPTNHVVFGEALAILAGDGLLNSAFEVMLNCAKKNLRLGLDYISAISIIAAASGTRGMIEGQSADIGFEGTEQSGDVLEHIHNLKTAALIKASVTCAAALFGADSKDVSALETYGSCIGLAFQIKDDILDETGKTDTIGKSAGKDADSDKQTFVRLYGIERSKQIAEEKTEEAIKALGRFAGRADGLAALARYLIKRES